ncbi:hypothetical protein ACFFT9_20980, partial [Chromobacterium violaceum]
MKDVMQPINTADKLFQDGNPNTGALGTIVTATWLNAVQGSVQSIQAELVSVLASLGISPDPNKNTQVLDAVRRIAWGGTTRPTTLAGYGITDAASKNGDSGQRFAVAPATQNSDAVQLGQMLDGLALKLPIDAQGRAITTAFRAKKGYPASDNATSGFAFETDGDTGVFAAGGDGTNSGVTEIALVIDSKPVFLAKPIGLWNQSYGWLHLYFAQKSTTLAGYGITDAAPA